MPQKSTAKGRIIIESDDKGIRAALTIDGEPYEFIDSIAGKESRIGSIYVGTVEAVTKSGFAFVDIGLERNAFLNLNDNKDAAIASTVKAGSLTAVQIVKDPYRDKGAAVTTKLTWPGRFFVIEKAQDAGGEINVSKKIQDAPQRARLTRIVQGFFDQGKNDLAGKNIVIRTDAANAAPSSLEAEFKALVKAMKAAEELISEANLESFDKTRLPLAVYSPYESPCHKMAAELMSGAAHISEILVNSEAEHQLLSKVYGSRGIKVILTSDSAFFTYNLSKAYETTRHRLVHLPSGGHIVVDKTEACVVIDVNSGQYSGRKSLEDMAFKINKEAAREAARQLRLRNLGGAVLIDFIGMKDPENIESLTRELKEALAMDPAHTTVEGMTRLGFWELTRKRR